MEQNIRYHSKREKKKYSEEILDQSKTKNQWGELLSLHLCVWCQCTLQISKSGIFNSLESPTKPRLPFNTSCKASLVLHAGTLLTHAWSQQPSLTAEGGDSITPFLHSWLESQNNQVDKVAKFCCWLGLVGCLLIQILLDQLYFRCFPSLLKLLFNSFSEVMSLAGWGPVTRSPLPLFHLASGFSSNF